LINAMNEQLKAHEDELNQCGDGDACFDHSSVSYSLGCTSPRAESLNTTRRCLHNRTSSCGACRMSCGCVS
jgi:hypothetical protein